MRLVLVCKCGVRKPDRIIASNPGTLRISIGEVEAGGVSDPRNGTLLSMFSLLNIGERAGSGYDTLREGTYSAGKPDPLLEELWEPDRVRLTLELETSGLAGFRLPGMGGEASPLVTEVEPPRGGQVNKPSDQVSDSASGTNVGNDVGNVGNVGNSVGNDVGNVVGAKALSVTERAVFDAIQANPIVTAKEIATAIGKSERQVERARASLRDAGLIERIGGTRGHWKVKR